MNSDKQNVASLDQNVRVAQLKRELFLWCEITGKQNALKGIPYTELELRAYCINHIESVIQVPLYQNHEIHAPVSGRIVARKILLDADRKVEKLQPDLDSLEHKLKPLKIQEIELKPDRRRNRIQAIIEGGVIALSGAEGLFAFDGFRGVPMPKLPATFSATALAIGIWAGVHFVFARYIQRAKNRIHQLIRYAVVLIPAFFLFAVLGNLRAHAYNQAIQFSFNPDNPSVGSQGISGWPLTLVSFLLFVIALVLEVRFSKTDEEREREYQYDSIHEQVENCEWEMHAIQTRIATIKREANAQATEALARWETARAVENELVAISDVAIDIYIQSNLLHSRKRPPVFFAYPPRCNFNLFFNNQTANQHETHHSNSIA
jgi:hypothetical protein